MLYCVHLASLIEKNTIGDFFTGTSQTILILETHEIHRTSILLKSHNIHHRCSTYLMYFWNKIFWDVPEKNQIKVHAHFKGKVFRNSENMLTKFKNLQNHWGNFNKTWHKGFLGDGDSIFLQIKGHAFSKGIYLRKSENILTKPPEPTGQVQPNLTQNFLW